MGLKVRSLFDDKEIKKKAKARKEKSDAVLETIYELLLEKKGEKLKDSDFSKKKVKLSRSKNG